MGLACTGLIGLTVYRASVFEPAKRPPNWLAGARDGGGADAQAPPRRPKRDDLPAAPIRPSRVDGQPEVDPDVEPFDDAEDWDDEDDALADERPLEEHDPARAGKPNRAFPDLAAGWKVPAPAGLPANLQWEQAGHLHGASVGRWRWVAPAHWPPVRASSETQQMVTGDPGRVAFAYATDGDAPLVGNHLDITRIEMRLTTVEPDGEAPDGEVQSTSGWLVVADARQLERHWAQFGPDAVTGLALDVWGMGRDPSGDKALAVCREQGLELEKLAWGDRWGLRGIAEEKRRAVDAALEAAKVPYRLQALESQTYGILKRSKRPVVSLRSPDDEPDWAIALRAAPDRAWRVIKLTKGGKPVGYRLVPKR
jgi:hypothetical protein